MNVLFINKLHSKSFLSNFWGAVQKDRRSLNNYVECLLLDAVYNEPNEETLASLEEAKAGHLEGPLDTSSVEAMLKSMNL